jgi:hypothetical protein
VGNLEASKSTPDTTTSVVIPAPTCASNVSGSISIARSGYLSKFGIKRFYQTVTLTNITAASVTGPIALVALNSTSTLFNASGATTCAAPLGSPYIIATPSSLAPGASVSVSLQFTDPTKAVTTYTTRVLAGTGVD